MAQSFNVNDFKSGLVYGGARPTLFSIQLTSPSGVSVDFRKVPILAKSSTLPPSNLGTIGIPYFGRVVKMAGDRTFPTWDVTVINDEDFKIRNALENWSNSINSMNGNVRLSGENVASYKTDATITQYSKAGDVLRTYTFEGLYPKNISTIDLGWDKTDQIEDFTVTFEYDSWTVQGGAFGAAFNNQG